MTSPNYHTKLQPNYHTNKHNKKTLSIFYTKLPHQTTILNCHTTTSSITNYHTKNKNKWPIRFDRFVKGEQLDNRQTQEAVIKKVSDFIYKVGGQDPDVERKGKCEYFADKMVIYEYE